MKNFFKRKVRILGRAIPVSVILLLAVTVVAVGAFLLSWNVDQNITAESAPGGAMSLLTCNIYEGKGTVDTCDLNGGSIDVVISGADNDTRVALDVRFTADTTNKVMSYDPGVLPPAVSEMTCFVNTADPCDGWVFIGDVLTPIHIKYKLGNLVPDEVISDFDFLLSFQDE